MEKEEFLRLLPKLIVEDNEIKGAIITALSGVIATKEDITKLIEHSDKRFEAMEEDLKKVIEHSDKRFEAVDKRFEVIDKRFEAIDKRFDAQDKKIDGNHDEVMFILTNIQQTLGKPFEQFARNVIVRLLKGEGIKDIKLEATKLKDPNEFMKKGNFEIEIDGLSLDPPVIVEITSILRNEKKIMIFLKKKQFVEKEYTRDFRGFFVAASSELNSEELGNITVKLRKSRCEFINL